MTTIPTGGYAAGQVGAAAAAAAPVPTSSGATLDSDAFLKLLVAQLKYQDPSTPVDSSAFMAQTAQLQMVETMHQLVAQNAALIGGQNSLSALSLVGQHVTWTVDGVTRTGAVDAVRLDASGPLLVVGDTEVPLPDVTRVSAPGPA